MRRVFHLAGIEIILESDAFDITELGGVSAKPFGGRHACEGKDKLDQRAAEGRVRSLEKRNGKPYDAYECGDHWHVGHSIHYFTLADKYR